jgi:hypothetical protein
VACQTGGSEWTKTIALPPRVAASTRKQEVPATELLGQACFRHHFDEVDEATNVVRPWSGRKSSGHEDLLLGTVSTSRATALSHASGMYRRIQRVTLFR